MKTRAKIDNIIVRDWKASKFFWVNLSKVFVIIIWIGSLILFQYDWFRNGLAFLFWFIGFYFVITLGEVLGEKGK